MGQFTNKEQNIMRSAGYSQTSDSDVWKKDSHKIIRREETTIFNTSSHTSDGKGISNTKFKNKAW